MLKENLSEKIEQVDILTDFDRTMILEQNPYMQISGYVLQLLKQGYMIDIIKIAEKLPEYKRSRDIRIFFSMLGGCPEEIIDNTAKRLRQNENWSRLIEKLKPEKVGIVSRNNQRVISRYLNNLEEKLPEIRITAANIPEVENGIYTGNVEINVNNGDLKDFVEKREYICGRDEKRFLENSGFYIKEAGKGLYICSKQKSFGIGWKQKKS